MNLIRPRRGQHRVAGFDEQAVWRETAIQPLNSRATISATPRHFSTEIVVEQMKMCSTSSPMPTASFAQNPALPCWIQLSP